MSNLINLLKHALQDFKYRWTLFSHMFGIYRFDSGKFWNLHQSDITEQPDITGSIIHHNLETF